MLKLTTVRLDLKRTWVTMCRGDRWREYTLTKRALSRLMRALHNCGWGGMPRGLAKTESLVFFYPSDVIAAVYQVTSDMEVER